MSKPEEQKKEGSSSTPKDSATSETGGATSETGGATSETGGATSETGGENARSLRLAYGDLTSEGPAYGGQQFRPEPYQGSHDNEDEYYAALSASTVAPSEGEGAVDNPAKDLGIVRPDEELVRAVTEVLAMSKTIDATGIEVECSAGVVTLSGRALDRDTKRAADDVAYGVLGVKDVMNQIACT